MNIFEAVGTKLTAIAGDAGVYAGAAEQSATLPLLIYNMAVTHRTDMGHSQTNEGRLSVACCATSFDASVALAYTIKAAMHAKQTTWGDVAIGHSTCTALGPPIPVEIEAGVIEFETSVEFSLFFGAES